MANDGSMNIPSGEVLFEQIDVRTHEEDSLLTKPCNGLLQIRLTQFGHVVSWQPEKDAGNKQAHGTVSKTAADSAEVLQSDTSKEKKVDHPSFWFKLSDIRSFIQGTTKDTYQMTFTLNDRRRMPSFIFHRGREGHFLENIGSKVRFEVSISNRNLYFVLKDYDNMLQKTLSSLDKFALTGANNTAVGRFVRDPLPALAGGLAKMTTFFTPTSQDCASRQVSDEAADLKPADTGESKNDITIDAHKEPGFDFVQQTSEQLSKAAATRSVPISSKEWLTYFDSYGRVVNQSKLRERIFRGGCASEIRQEAWEFLLGVYDFSTTRLEREEKRMQLAQDYFRMKGQWQSISPDQQSRFVTFTDRKKLIEDDMATDTSEYRWIIADVLKTYVMYDFDLGYVQGMSGLLLPIFSAMSTEYDVFWCFVKLVSLTRENFIGPKEMEKENLRPLISAGVDNQLQQLRQLLIKTAPSFVKYLDEHSSGNLNFGQEWLRLLFVKQFSLEDISRLWEVLWTRLPCTNFKLLFFAAILEEEQIPVMENRFGHLEIAKYFTNMRYKIPLEKTLVRAEKLYLQLWKMPEAAEILDSFDIADDTA